MDLICRRRSVLSGAMGIQIDVVVSYPIKEEMEKVLGLAEATGEPVTVTFMPESGNQTRKRAVLVPAATLARWEHWAPGPYPSEEGANQTRTQEPELAHPAEYGAFTLFRRRTTERTAVAREGVVVAELLAPDEAHWLQKQARRVREGFMDPVQKAAFEEFLSRQPPVGKR